MLATNVEKMLQVDLHSTGDKDAPLLMPLLVIMRPRTIWMLTMCRAMAKCSMYLIIIPPWVWYIVFILQLKRQRSVIQVVSKELELKPRQTYQMGCSTSLLKTHWAHNGSQQHIRGGPICTVRSSVTHWYSDGEGRRKLEISTAQSQWKLADYDFYNFTDWIQTVILGTKQETEREDFVESKS